MKENLNSNYAQKLQLLAAKAHEIKMKKELLHKSKVTEKSDESLIVGVEDRKDVSADGTWDHMPVGTEETLNFEKVGFADRIEDSAELQNTSLSEIAIEFDSETASARKATLSPIKKVAPQNNVNELREPSPASTDTISEQPRASNQASTRAGVPLKVQKHLPVIPDQRNAINGLAPRDKVKTRPRPGSRAGVPEYNPVLINQESEGITNKIRPKSTRAGVPNGANQLVNLVNGPQIRPRSGKLEALPSLVPERNSNQNRFAFLNFFPSFWINTPLPPFSPSFSILKYLEQVYLPLKTTLIMRMKKMSTN